MSGELEAAGALTTAGLAGGVIEGREATRAGEGACANCEAPLTGRYCANCGQAAILHRSILHVGAELLHSVFSFDTKIWHTAPLLLFRPGTLTRNYVYGKRARYISPLALFLFCIFLLFFTFSFIPPPVNINSGPDTRADVQERLQDARDGVHEIEGELAPLRQQIAAGTADTGDRAEAQGLETALRAAQAELTRRERALAEFDAAAASKQGGVQVSTSTRPGFNASIQTGEPPATPAPATTAPTTATPVQGGSPSPAAPQAPTAPEIQNPYPAGSLENALYGISQNEELQTDGISNSWADTIRTKLSNPPLLLYRLQDAASKFSFLLVPISLPFIAFLFLFKRGISFYDHAVFALYALCFASLLFAVVMTAGSVHWLQWLPATLITVALPVHTFFHLKGAYALGTWSALWRTFFLLIFANIALVIFLGIILIVGFAE